ncbi:alpha/beta hydrolase [Mycobacteroides abscessus]|uniref:alpha/beta hydrolase n=1 Tax=Mycobacteroides abscessus TaxID=36809 RepID=UPI000D3E0EDD|nr:alpha/beta hydrolase [Mycobacteroides abscessus]PVB31733.1 hypothetical protein DDJ45_02905 [Mycobacteroides abscessus]
MALTLADIESLDVETVRDAAKALEKQANSMDNTKAGLGKLPIQGHWTGVSATAAFGNMDGLGKFMIIHCDDYRASAKGMYGAADGFDGAQQVLKKLEAFAEDHGFRLDKASGTVTALKKDHDPSDMEYIVTTAKQVLAAGESSDAQLTRAVGLLDGPVGDDSDAGSGPWILDKAKELAKPEEFTRWWESLTEDQKQDAYNRDPFIGNHPGMPFEDRTRFNEKHLVGLTQAAQANVDQLRAAHPDWAQGKFPTTGEHQREIAAWKTQWDTANRSLAGYQQVAKSMQEPDGMRRYLGYIDDQGRAATSINNPDNAKRIATYVPGTGQDLPRLEYSTSKSVDMLGAALTADKTLKPSDVSVTTWMGYDRPMNIIPEAASTSYAHNGAQALDDFQAGLRASHNDGGTGGQAIQTVIGHSYGSTLVGGAATDGHHLDANNVITVGSPGILAQHASDLNLAPGATVFSTRAENDVIGIATYASLGPDPMSAGFGATPFEAAPGPAGPLGIPTIDAHSSYWDQNNPALANMGKIIAGRTDVTPPRFTP